MQCNVTVTDVLSSVVHVCTILKFASFFLFCATESNQWVAYKRIAPVRQMKVQGLFLILTLSHSAGK